MPRTNSTNTYSNSRYIVDNVTPGCYSSIQSAINQAVADGGKAEIWVRAGTYTENLTLYDTVDIAGADSALSIIVGKNTFTAAGTVVISNIKLQTNGDYFLSVTGNAASIIQLDSCTLICSNNTGIQFSSSSASSYITLNNCFGDIQANGITFFAHTGKGGIVFYYSSISNSGSSTTISALLNGSFYSFYSSFNFGTSTAGGTISCFFTFINVQPSNVTAITTSTAGSSYFSNGIIWSGTVAIFAIGAGTTLNAYNNHLSSNTATVVTGSGNFYQGSNVYNWAVVIDPLLTQIYGTVSGINRIYTTNTPFSVNTGTGAINIGTDAVAKTVSVGNTTGASVLALKCGTGEFTLASATGTIISALDTGEITEPLQPAFLAYTNSAQNNVTGNATFYTVLFATEVYDQNADFASSTFTAPVTGKYRLETLIASLGYASNNTINQLNIPTSNRTYASVGINGYACRRSDGYLSMSLSCLADMDVADTAYVVFYVGGGSKVINIFANSDSYTFFSGNLEC